MNPTITKFQCLVWTVLLFLDQQRYCVHHEVIGGVEILIHQTASENGTRFLTA